MSTEGLRVISGVWASGVDGYTAFSAARNQDRIDHNQDQPIQRNQICVRRMGLENHDPKPTLLPGDRGHHRLIYTFSYHSIVLFPVIMSLNMRPFGIGTIPSWRLTKHSSGLGRCFWLGTGIGETRIGQTGRPTPRPRIVWPAVLGL